ncbi:Rpn family recombination-promoting nuclease/putative transposase [Chitinimonas arctica]|nr:Rpn family recombination-promoting nuclease/putative transposase [Chitinimonas arctica]
MLDNDAAYKCLFSYPHSVEKLLREFIREDWVKQLDFASLERINGSFVSDRWRRQMSDVVWKVRLADQDLYVCLLLEFQSSIDPIMALRVASYVLQLYLDLCKDSKPLPLTASGKLPPVLPIVLYNGEPRWSAPLELDELIEAGPGCLPDYRPHMRHFLLDQGAYREQDFTELDNVAVAIFRLENAKRPDAMVGILCGLLRYLAAPEHAGLRRALTNWLTRVLIPTKFKQLDWSVAQLNEVSDLQGVETMLANDVERWMEEWVQKGKAEGLEEGLEKGEAKLLRRQLLRKFDPLPDWVEERLSGASTEQLESWGDQILTASSVDEVFAPH